MWKAALGLMALTQCALLQVGAVSAFQPSPEQALTEQTPPEQALTEQEAAADTPFDLTCPIEERTEDLAPGVTVRHECYGIRGHAVVHIAEVDLTNPSLRFKTTPGDSAGGREFAGATTSAFARDHDLLLAVNAGYFEPFNSGTHGKPAYPDAGDPVNVMGQHIAGGEVVSDNAIAIPRFRLRVDGAFCAVWNAVRIVDGVCPPGTEQGIGSGPVLMRAGLTPSFSKFDARFAIKRAPRTVAAVNEDRSILWLIVADGRQPDYSAGINLPELADLLRGLGAHDALNLDGGGSAVMVGPEGRVLSRPIHMGEPGRERVVANHIGIYLEDGSP